MTDRPLRQTSPDRVPLEVNEAAMHGDDWRVEYWTDAQVDEFNALSTRPSPMTSTPTRYGAA